MIIGLAGSLPATGRAYTDTEGAEEISVAATEEELNNAMVNTCLMMSSF